MPTRWAADIRNQTQSLLIWESPNRHHPPPTDIAFSPRRWQDVAQFSHQPEGEEKAVAHKDAHAPDHGETEADVAEVLVGAREQVPGGQLLGGEALCDLVVHEALHALLVELHLRKREREREREGEGEGEREVQTELNANTYYQSMFIINL